VYGAYSQNNRFYNPETNSAKQRYITFVARPQAFAVKVPAFFVSGLPTALAAPLMLVGLQTYKDLVNVGNVSETECACCFVVNKTCRAGCVGREPHNAGSAVRAPDDEAEAGNVLRLVAAVRVACHGLLWRRAARSSSARI
jgi:hypothetical protein